MLRQSKKHLPADNRRLYPTQPAAPNFVFWLFLQVLSKLRQNNAIFTQTQKEIFSKCVHSFVVCFLPDTASWFTPLSKSFLNMHCPFSNLNL